jgi:hypothetical protein
MIKVTVKDALTGETRVSDGPRPFEWVLNNWSCDCNRGLLFGIDKAECTTTRFRVVAVEGDTEGYSLSEFNEMYPDEKPVAINGQGG